MRRKLLPIVAVLMVGVLTATTACGGGGKRKKKSSTSRPAGSSAKKIIDDDDTVAAAPATATPRPTSSSTRRTAALTCAGLRNARVGNNRVRFNGYPDYLPLSNGRWSGEDGATVELQRPCGVGDLNGDAAADAVGAVLLDQGGTGRYWTLVVWRNDGGRPVFQSLADLGDRTPVESITVSGRQARVVYLTRSADRSSAELNIRRTANYRLSGTRFTEVSHTDATYRP